MKHILLILFILPSLAMAQSTSREVVSAGGDEFTAANGSLGFTLGETAIEKPLQPETTPSRRVFGRAIYR